MLFAVFDVFRVDNAERLVKQFAQLNDGFVGKMQLFELFGQVGKSLLWR